ncbi:hypothetical protein QYN14_25660 [Rhodococcus ruber]|uniref:hypothetical protein n=1 Tax=Rhodococcus ruber TaxID=1830 RepID=UPI00265A5D9B|nr:hypothetical protein [Rhodococcus ruber]WKK11936.1 hypothetical protein QYN14_25240 [Rhodococcus ruber]WKK12020.1 hypothetical protein QYN14_25660 [Rhodococcus ruber]
MTTTEITPEVLRDVADWIDGTGHGLGPGAALRDEADRIERDQADEKRIDELVRVLHVAQMQAIKRRETSPARAGIRAVLAHLEQERAAAADQNKAAGTIYSGPISMSPDDERTIPDGAPYMHGRDYVVGERWPASEPRTWNDLRDVPDDVNRVRRTTDDAVAVRDPWLSWLWEGSSVVIPKNLYDQDVFVEVIADA